MMLRIWAFVLLFLVFDGYCNNAGDEYDQYEGPVVCTGTKPLIIHEERSTVLYRREREKQLFEQYWYQMYNHLHGCEIIVGNLIIPHQHYVPFEEHRINEAIEKIEIVTGYIYIYDVSLNLNFKSLKMVYGNELFKYPSTWSDYNSTKDEAYLQEYAIFVENFTAESLVMPELRYIKNGKIGFKDTPKACVWDPKKELLYFDQFFDTFEPYNKLVYAFNDGKTFGECSEFSQTCHDQNCLKCFDSKKDNCQKTTKRFCEWCKHDEEKPSSFCIAHNETEITCCPENCHGGCDHTTDLLNCFHCKEGYFLEINTTNLGASRKCVKECDGKIIDGTDICLAKSNACPDYMFSFDDDRICSYRCPDGMEFDPIEPQHQDGTTSDKGWEDYWSSRKNICKPCRLIYNSKTKNFDNECGISCVIQSNSLSFVTILNIYPAITKIEDYDFYKFNQIFNETNDDNISNPIFDKKCRHIYGFLHIDQNSIGYPEDGVRLTPDHFRILTYATGLYGSIRIEFTDGYWLADSFRNIHTIKKPIKGKIAYDQEYFNNSITIRYNSDLRTIDFQRLSSYYGEAIIENNPFWIPFKQNDSLFLGKNFFDPAMKNAPPTTFYGDEISRETGCIEDSISFYYQRCKTCGSGESFYFTSEYPDEPLNEYFAECIHDRDNDSTTHCSALPLTFQRDLYGSESCVKCDENCKTACTDQTPLSCYDGTDKTELDCKNKQIIEMNIKACIGEECPNGFYQNETSACKRCDSACQLCYGEGYGYIFPQALNSASNLDENENATLNGCKTCGLILMSFDETNKKLNTYCINFGAAPRCPPSENCQFLATNPVRDLWENVKPSINQNKIEFNDYGEHI